MKVNWNVLMITIGLVLLAVGIFRIDSSHRTSMDLRTFSKSFLKPTIPLVAFLAFTIFMGCRRVSLATVIREGNAVTLSTSASLFLMLILIVIVMGYGSAIGMNHYKSDMERALTGKHVPIKVLGLSVAVATSSAVSLIVKDIWKSKPEARPAIIMLILTSTLLSAGIFFFRVLGLNLDIALRVYGYGAVLALWVYPTICAVDITLRFLMRGFHAVSSLFTIFIPSW